MFSCLHYILVQLCIKTWTSFSTSWRCKHSTVIYTVQHVITHFALFQAFARLSHLISQQWSHFHAPKPKPSAASFRERLSHLKMVCFTKTQARKNFHSKLFLWTLTISIAQRQMSEVYGHLSVAKQVASEINLVFQNLASAETFKSVVAWMYDVLSCALSRLNRCTGIH